MKNFIVKTFIYSWLAQLFSFVQGHTKNFRDDNPGYLTAFLLSATTSSPFALLDQEHSGVIDVQHDCVRSSAYQLCSEPGKNYKNKAKQPKKKENYSKPLEMVLRAKSKGGNIYSRKSIKSS